MSGKRIRLGDLAKDVISGVEGVVIGTTDWLFGCRRLTLQPKAVEGGKPVDPVTFDEPQLVLVQSAIIERPTASPVLRDPGGPRPGPTRRVAPR